MRFFLPLLLLAVSPFLAQSQPDSTRVLNEVTVQAYESNRPLLEFPSAIALVGKAELNRFSNVNLLQAVNLVPGIRMEERSPGSYRFSIRGSTLRSPFGVRNVKVYWNNLPFTDPGGNTYLNLLDPGSLQRMEIIKGPGSSLYGAGTGGVLLLQSEHPRDERSLQASILAGSFGLRGLQLSFREGDANSSHHIQYLHQQSDGYRKQSRMVRDMVNSTFRFQLADRQVLETALIYSDLYYQTPGGLTQAEVEANPRQARPAAGIFPGAVEQQAAVSSKSFFAGVTHQYQFAKWQNRTSLYGNFVQFENSAIRNYERRAEQNVGGRTVTEYQLSIGEAHLNLVGGGEFQFGFSPIKVYDNLAGVTGIVQSDNEIQIWTYSIFGQGELSWKKWLLTAGASINGLNYGITTLAPLPSTVRQRKFDRVFSPRVAGLFKLTEQASLYGSASYGYSPPTLAEILPSTGELNTSLKPESGFNLEVGARGSLRNRQLNFDITLYRFLLDEAIVVRRDASGADFFVNAGDTEQNGMELMINWRPAISPTLTHFNLWSGVTLNHYRFGNYAKLTSDFSGNNLTGVPDHIVTGGLDIGLRQGWYASITANQTSRLPLDDANSNLAGRYLLVGLRAGFKKEVGAVVWDVFAGGDNLLDEHYSLGNDLNAAGGRFFNPAATRSFYAGLTVKFNARPKKS